MRNRFYLIVLLICILTISGCGDLKAMQFWAEDGKENVAGEQTESKDQTPDTEEAKDFAVTSAKQLENEDRQTFYGAGDYAELAGFIQKSVLDNFFSGVLQGEVTKTADNPYLMGDTTEDGSPKEKLTELKQKIAGANLVKWEIAQITPVTDNRVLIAVHYYLADGREATSETFLATLQAEEWYIDFETFYDSFDRVSQFAAAGSEQGDLEQ